MNIRSDLIDAPHSNLAVILNEDLPEAHLKEDRQKTQEFTMRMHMMRMMIFHYFVLTGKMYGFGA